VRGRRALTTDQRGELNKENSLLNQVLVLVRCAYGRLDMAPLFTCAAFVVGSVCCARPGRAHELVSLNANLPRATVI
jgi:hypothetical protein